MGRTHYLRGAPNLFLGLEDGGGDNEGSLLGLSMLTRDAREERVLFNTCVYSAKQTAWTGSYGGVSFHRGRMPRLFVAGTPLQSCEQYLRPSNCLGAI